MLPALEEANHESSFLCPCRRTLSQTTNRMSNHSETAYKTCDRLSFERDFQICGCRWYFPNNTKAGAQVKKKRESSKRFIVDKYRLNRNWVHSPPLAASYILRFIKPRRAKRLVAVMPRRSLSAGDGVEGLPRGGANKGRRYSLVAAGLPRDCSYLNKESRGKSTPTENCRMAF